MRTRSMGSALMVPVLISVTLTILAVVPAQAALRLTILTGEAADGDKAALYISVIDENNRPVKGLTPDDLRIEIEGKPLAEFDLQPVSTSKAPLSVLLAVDVSGSMKGRPYLSTKRALSVFLDQLSLMDNVALLSFGTQVRTVSDWTREHYKVRAAIESLTPTEQWTHLYDAILTGLDTGEEAPTSRASIVLLTDGRDEGSQNGRQAAMDRAAGAGVPIFTLGFGTKTDQEFLTEVAAASDGLYMATPQPDSIITMYEKVLDVLRHQYVATFPFQREAGVYMAKVSLDTPAGQKSDRKEFLFRPLSVPGLPPPVDSTVGLQPVHWALIVGFPLAILAITIILHRRRRHELELLIEEWQQNLGQAVEQVAGDACELEFPAQSPNIIDYTQTISTDRTQVAVAAPQVYLAVEGLTGPVPLIYHGKECLDELVVARRSADSSEYRLPTVTYLWTSNTNVSRSSDERPGHARFFVDPATSRHVVKDFGSLNGTLHNGQRLSPDDTSPPLQDGDVIELGGRNGVRVVYRQSKQAPTSESIVNDLTMTSVDDSCH